MKYFVFLLILVSQSAYSQDFAPSAGHAGTTAVHKSDIRFQRWATSCEVERAYIQISEPTVSHEGSVYATFGKPENALQSADNQVVSLGDGGVATLYFQPPIQNVSGYDFAIFENGFIKQGDDYLAFLELAFVEVSSDGEHFFRFPAVSQTPTDEQLAGFGYLDARNIHNFAGKYTADYGTPFDLEELANQAELDIDAITHIRIIDVIGSLLDDYASFDSEGNKINDPFPTPFSSGGFDLDAVGVMSAATKNTDKNFPSLSIFPSPAASGNNLFISGLQSGITEVMLYTITGKLLKISKLENDFYWKIPSVKAGIYLLKVKQNAKIFTKKLLIN